MWLSIEIMQIRVDSYLDSSTRDAGAVAAESSFFLVLRSPIIFFSLSNNFDSFLFFSASEDSCYLHQLFSNICDIKGTKKVLWFESYHARLKFVARGIQSCS